MPSPSPRTFSWAFAAAAEALKTGAAPVHLFARDKDGEAAFCAFNSESFGAGGGAASLGKGWEYLGAFDTPQSADDEGANWEQAQGEQRARRHVLDILDELVRLDLVGAGGIGVVHEGALVRIYDDQGEIRCIPEDALKRLRKFTDDASADDVWDALEKLDTVGG